MPNNDDARDDDGYFLKDSEKETEAECKTKRTTKHKQFFVGFLESSMRNQSWTRASSLRRIHR